MPGTVPVDVAIRVNDISAVLAFFMLSVTH